MARVDARETATEPSEGTPLVGVAACSSYDLDAVRNSLACAMAPLGGMAHYVRPGMRVLLKPNLLLAASPERAVTTHPTLIRAVAEVVREAGGVVLIGDSPAGSPERFTQVCRKSGAAEAADAVPAKLVAFDEPAWRTLSGHDYFVSRVVLEADLVINLPKLKTHALTLYTGAVKNLFGALPGYRKREVHLRAPGVRDFSAALVDVLELVRPGLTIMDGILGMEGDGPGPRGAPHSYGVLAASADPVALDAVLSRAMGYRPGEVRHLALAGERGLGCADPRLVSVAGDEAALEFGRVRLPAAILNLDVLSWIAAPVYRAARLRPQVTPSFCTGCGRCVEVCPRSAIRVAPPAQIDLDLCVGCMCCSEVCPHAAIAARRNLLARLVGAGG